MIRWDRIEKAQQGMQDQGIDAYLVLTHDDYIYFFGEDRYQPRAIVPARGEPILVVFQAELPEVQAKYPLEQVKLFATVGQQMRDVVETMKSLAAHKGPDGKLTVGVQMGFATPAFLLNMFQKANPSVTITPINPVMDPLRLVKSPDEVALIQRAAEIADIGMRTAAQTLRPGLTENEVAAEVEYAMRKAGGHGVATPVFVNSGYRSAWLHGTASDKRIEAGDLVVLDLVPRYQGYCANLCRTFVMGDPTPDQQRLINTYREAMARGLEAMRPGAPIKAIDDAARPVYEANGLGEQFVFGLSHSIGLTFEEMPAPTIFPAHTTVPLQVGMTVTLGHSVLAVPGIGGVRFEDTFHLTDSGPVPLTRYGHSYSSL
jgi:Xaa-Pro aminopeptidase